MLEQYRKEALEDKDLLPDTETTSRRRLLFILAGAAFAIVFFLFLMGMFRSEDDTLVNNKNEAVTKESVVSMEDKLQGVLARLDRLEKQLEGQKVTTQIEQTDVSKAEQAPLQSAEEGIAMTHEAIKSMLNKEVAALEPKVCAKKETSKIAKAKDKKAKNSAKHTVATAKGGSNYTVKKGDTLSKISLHFFGTPNRWKVIYDANKERIANMNQLKVGTSLIIPQEAKQ